MAITSMRSKLNKSPLTYSEGEEEMGIESSRHNNNNCNVNTTIIDPMEPIPFCYPTTFPSHDDNNNDNSLVEPMMLVPIQMGNMNREFVTNTKPINDISCINVAQEQKRAQRRQALSVHLKMLEHASFCCYRINHPNHSTSYRDPAPPAVCPVKHCAKMKGHIRHTRICQKKVLGGCKICKRMWTLMRTHAANCENMNCAVPQCKKIKKKIAQMSSRRCGERIELSSSGNSSSSCSNEIMNNVNNTNDENNTSALAALYRPRRRQQNQAVKCSSREAKIEYDNRDRRRLAPIFE